MPVLLRFSFRYDHAHAVFGPERDHGSQPYRMIRNQPHLPLLGQRGQQQDSLQPGEAFTNAATWATAKRKVGKLRS